MEKAIIDGIIEKDTFIEDIDELSTSCETETVETDYDFYYSYCIRLLIVCKFFFLEFI